MAQEISNFHQARANIAKSGAYYTNLEHCRDIRKMLVFPENEEVCVIEPSIGDGSAVIAVTGVAENSNIKIFGVELNDAVAEETKKNPLICELLKADFKDCIIRRNSFSFCFGNPPYITEKNDAGIAERTEYWFLDKVNNYLKTNSVLVWVIPLRIMSEEAYIRNWCRNYETLALYKFRDSEFDKFKQCVIIGRKVSTRLVGKDEAESFRHKWLSDVKDLPHEPTERIEVFPSQEKDITLFTTKFFNFNEAFELLKKGLPDDIGNYFEKKVTVPCFSGGELKRPPIPLKKDSLYLLATSGYGQGLAGSEENRDLHLQRGVAEIIETERVVGEDFSYEDEDEDKPGTLVVQTKTSISMSIIENNGTITRLI